MRVRLEITVPGLGEVACLVAPYDLSEQIWTERLALLAEVMFASHPDAEWRAVPIPDDVSDKTAMTGH